MENTHCAEELKLFPCIRISELLPTVNQGIASCKQHLWNCFFDINLILSKRLEDITSSDIENYEKLSREWGFEYLKIYHTKEVTPYIHAMIFPVGEFENTWVFASLYTTQAREIQ